MKFKYLDYFVTIWSVALIVITVFQWFLKAAWIYVIFSFLIFFLLGSIWFFYVMWKRPWNPSFRSELLKPFGTNYPFSVFYKTVFMNPRYESNYITPKMEDVNLIKEPFDMNDIRSKISVIIEDDPVGFICHRGIVPAFIVDEHMDRNVLFDNFLRYKDRINVNGIFFVSTPSRRLDKNGSFILNREIGYALRKFRNEFDREFRIISKIDSCLRSNYEAEFSGLTDGYGVFSLQILAPSYIEQGRITAHGSQYVRDKKNLIPLHESEFSGFKGLEYRNSNLALWLEFRCSKIVTRKNVGLVCVDNIRKKSSVEIVNNLQNRPKNLKVIVFDSCDNDDLTNVLKILLSLENSGKEKMFYKFGPSMINRLVNELKCKTHSNHISGISPNDTAIIVAGSLSTITKRQISCLRDEEKTSLVVLSNKDIENQVVYDVIEKKRKKIIEYNSRGDNVVLTTEYWKEASNEYPDIQKRDKVLNILARICRLAKEQVKHRWIVLKGSDTALHILNYGFGLKKFDYCGQIVPGVIHIKVKLGDSNCDKSCFIIGGNVGEEELLVKLVAEIKKQASLYVEKRK